MNIVHVPIPIPVQHHTMHDGSMALNQKDVKTVLEQLIHNTININNNFQSLDESINDLRKELNDQNTLYRHFMDYINQHHSEAIKQYATTLLVQAKLEKANGT